MQLVSVIIPVRPSHNNKNILGACLESINNQSYPKDKIESVLIGDNCEPHLELCPKEMKVVTYNFKSHVGAAKARNKGIELSKGDLVAFIDADAIAHNRWLENFVGRFKNDNIAGFGGKILGFKDRCMNEDNVYGKSNLSPFTGLGNAIYKRSVLEEIGLLDEQAIVAEDVDLSWRTYLKGYRIEYIKEAIVYHKHIPSMKELIHDFFLNGMQIRIFIQKYKEIVRILPFSKFEERATLFYDIKGYPVKIISYLCGYMYQLLLEKIRLSKSIKEINPKDKFFKPLRDAGPLAITIADAPLIKPPHIIWWKLEDGCRIIDLENLRELELDGQSAKLWEYIIDGNPRDIIFEQIMDDFEVRKEELEQDLDDFIAQLCREKILCMTKTTTH